MFTVAAGGAPGRVGRMVSLDGYAGRPKMDSTSGVLLGMRLIKAAPKRRSARLNAALEGVRAATVSAQKVRQERSRRKPENLRPYDKKVDDGWGGLHGMLASLARFEGEEKAARAQGMLARLFRDGTSFLAASYEAEWLHGETLLGRIEDEKLETELTELTDTLALPYVRAAQEALGEALGVGDAGPERASTTALAEALDALAEAVSDYVRILAGETDKNDSTSVARFERAVVAPMERAREYHARRRGGATGTEPIGADEDPSAPVPPIDGGPVDDA